MTTSEKNSLIQALRATIVRLLVFAMVAFGAIDYALVAPYLESRIERAVTDSVPLSFAECR